MEERVASPSDAGERAAMRERLLTLLAERSYHYRPEKPFTLASGATSPFYLDARVTTWDPEAKPLIGALVFDLVNGKADAIGGLTLGADPRVHRPQAGEGARHGSLDRGQHPRR
jgi:hypothetical protein